MALFPAVTLLLPALLLAARGFTLFYFIPPPPPIAIVLGAVCLYSITSLGDSVLPTGLIPKRAVCKSACCCDRAFLSSKRIKVPSSKAPGRLQIG